MANKQMTLSCSEYFERYFFWFSFTLNITLVKTGYHPGGGKTICPSPTAVRRWQKSRRIYVRPRTGPLSAQLWSLAMAKLQVDSVPIA